MLYSSGNILPVVLQCPQPSLKTCQIRSVPACSDSIAYCFPLGLWDEAADTTLSSESVYLLFPCLNTPLSDHTGLSPPFPSKGCCEDNEVMLWGMQRVGAQGGWVSGPLLSWSWAELGSELLAASVSWKNRLTNSLAKYSLYSTQLIHLILPHLLYRISGSMKQAAMLPFLELLWGDWSEGVVTHNLSSFQGLLGRLCRLNIKDVWKTGIAGDF